MNMNMNTTGCRVPTLREKTFTVTARSRLRVIRLCRVRRELQACAAPRAAGLRDAMVSLPWVPWSLLVVEEHEQGLAERIQAHPARPAFRAAMKREALKMRRQATVGDGAGFVTTREARLNSEGTRERLGHSEVAAAPASEGEAHRRRGPLGRFDIDESPGAAPISEQLKSALKRSAGKVIDLFRSWDVDHDGLVTRAEFHRAMSLLGLDVPSESIDELFTSWQHGKASESDDELTMKELTHMLRAKSLTETIRAALIKRGGKSVHDHFQTWARMSLRIRADTSTGAPSWSQRLSSVSDISYAQTLTLTRDDFDRALVHLLGRDTTPVDPLQVEQLFGSLDRSHTGSISIDELELAVRPVNATKTGSGGKHAAVREQLVDSSALRTNMVAKLHSIYLEQPSEPSPLPPSEYNGEVVADQPKRRRNGRAARERINALSSPAKSHTHPPVRRNCHVELPPMPPKLTRDRLYELKVSRSEQMLAQAELLGGGERVDDIDLSPRQARVSAPRQRRMPTSSSAPKVTQRRHRVAP